MRRPILSAALFFAAPLGPFPTAPLQALVNLAAAILARGHPSMFGRARRNATLLIEPIDLPWCFVLQLGRVPPSILLVRRDARATADATIRAPMSVLLDLLEGRVDGDALFFSRELAVEGDMELAVALRNAVDDAQICLIEDLLAPLGSVADIAGRVGRTFFSAAEGAAARLNSLLARRARGATE